VSAEDLAPHIREPLHRERPRGGLPIAYWVEFTNAEANGARRLSPFLFAPFFSASRLMAGAFASSS